MYLSLSRSSSRERDDGREGGIIDYWLCARKLSVVSRRAKNVSLFGDGLVLVNNTM